MATQLTLIRHGHTEWNGLGRYQGHAPIPLSARGLAQARCLAGALADGPTFAAIYSSDLIRCRQTVTPIAEGLGLPVTYDGRFREIDYGHWQGLTWTELDALDPVQYQAYRDRPFEVQIPGGESQQWLVKRVLAGLSDILAICAGTSVLLVTHGGLLREILRFFGLWQGGSPAGNASRTVIAIDATGRAAQVILQADVSHLPPDLRPESSGTAFIT